MLEVRKTSDTLEMDDYGGNGKLDSLSSQARLQSAASILAMAVLRRKSRKAVDGTDLVGREESARLPGEGLALLSEQSVHS
jgi:hypothetical protein